jgi:hypothetical protein
VRAFLVEDLDEVVEASLLLQEVASRRFSGFFLQGEMHAFVTAILLGMAGLNAFDANAQAEPPDGELAQVKQGVGRGEGHTIIAADVGGQAALLEKPASTANESGVNTILAASSCPFEFPRPSAWIVNPGTDCDV